MREDKTTNVTVTTEISGLTVACTQSVSNHELEEGTAALINSVLLLKSNLGEA